MDLAQSSAWPTVMTEIDVDLRNPGKLAERRKAEQAVLKYIGAKPSPQKPANLIRQVANRQHISESLVRQAVWVLLDREAIQLTNSVRIARVIKP